MDTNEKLDSSLQDIIANDSKATTNGKALKPRQRQGPYNRQFANRGPAVRGNRIYVGNLDFSVSWQDLKDQMRAAGEVVHAKILQNPDGSSKGCGIVEFSTPQDAERAIAELNGLDINGREVFIREDRDAGSAPAAAAGPRRRQNFNNQYGNQFNGQFNNQYAPYPNQFNNNFGYNQQNYGYEYKQSAPFPNRRKLTNDIGSSIRFNHPADHQVYIGNLPWTCSWQDLKTLASKFGQVVRADILEDNTGRSRGAGTVVFTTGEAAAACIQALNGTEYESRELTVRYDAAAQKRAELIEPGAKLYVGNLPWSASWQDLKDLFSKFGDVVRADVAMDRISGKSKGFGTIAFAKKADAEAAMNALNETEFRGRNIQVRPDQFVPKTAQQ